MTKNTVSTASAIRFGSNTTGISKGTLSYPHIVIVLTIASMLAAGCTVGPNFHRPGLTLSQAWLDSNDARLTNTTSTDYRSWWKTFDDPVLDTLIEKAYHENLSLRIAGVRVLEARAQLGIVTAGLFPQSQFVSSSLQNIRTSHNSNPNAPENKYTEASIATSATWELDFWGKFRREIESNKANWLASVADYDNALVSLTADVANAYIDIRTLEKRLNIARQNIALLKQTLGIVEARLNYGTGTQLDVDQAKTILSSTMSLIPELEIKIRQSQNALCILLGMAPQDLADYLHGESGIPVSPTYIAVGIPADLLRRRPDIRSAEYQAAALCAQIGVAKAELYPAFSLTGTFGFSSSDIGTAKLRDIFKADSRMSQFGPSMQWNIFNFGGISNNIRLQDARFQELLIKYQQTVLAAQQEVEDNLVSFLKAQERAQILADTTVSAQSAFMLATKQYQEGIKDFTSVLITQQSLLDAQDNLTITLGNIANSLIGVYRALGGGWEIREGQALIPDSVKKDMEQRTNWGKLLVPVAYNPPINNNSEDNNQTTGSGERIKHD